MPARGAIHSASGQLRASCWPTSRPVREVHSLDWDRWARVTPASKREVFAPRLGRAYRTERPATSQEAWPEVAPKGPTPQRQEPWWNAVRRACPLPTLPHNGGGKGEKGARRIARCGGFRNTFAGVPLPFFFVIVFRHCERRFVGWVEQSETHQTAAVGYAASAANPTYVLCPVVTDVVGKPRTQHAPRERIRFPPPHAGEGDRA